MPLDCLREVLEEKPGRCFYYFEGFCCASYVADGGLATEPACVLDDGFAQAGARRLGRRDEDPVKVELRERKRISLLKREMGKYLPMLRERGARDAIWTPRMIFVVKEFAKILHGCRFWRMEAWRSLPEMDEILIQLYEGGLVVRRELG